MVDSMPEYEFVFVLKPTGFFGLPEEGRVVCPAGTQMLSPIADTLTGNIVAHGTLSKYRDNPIDQKFTVEGIRFQVKDNYLTIRFESDSDESAMRLASVLQTRFCMLLSAKSRRYYHADFLQGVDETKKSRILPPLQIRLGSTTLYSLESLSREIDAVRKAFSVYDDRLDKACAYFYHAVFLRTEVQRLSPTSFHWALVQSNFMLNLYKAASTIVGEAGVDRGYQSRYKTFGMSDQLWQDVETLRNLRNDLDIAHYSPTWTALKELPEHGAFAVQTAQRVIEEYIGWLESQKSEESPSASEEVRKDQPIKQGGPNMKVILSIAIAVKGEGVHSILQKEYDTQLYPIPGVEIENSAWKESKVPASIICNFDEGYYLLNFQSVKLDTEEHCEREEEMYRGHGWKSPSEL